MELCLVHCRSAFSTMLSFETEVIICEAWGVGVVIRAKVDRDMRSARRTFKRGSPSRETWLLSWGSTMT